MFNLDSNMRIKKLNAIKEDEKNRVLLHYTVFNELKYVKVSRLDDCWD